MKKLLILSVLLTFFLGSSFAYAEPKKYKMNITSTPGLDCKIVVQLTDDKKRIDVGPQTNPIIIDNLSKDASVLIFKKNDLVFPSYNWPLLQFCDPKHDKGPQTYRCKIKSCG